MLKSLDLAQFLDLYLTCPTVFSGRNFTMLKLFYVAAPSTDDSHTHLTRLLSQKSFDKSLTFSVEYCYYLSLSSEISNEDMQKLVYLLGKENSLHLASTFSDSENSFVIEVGPRYVTSHMLYTLGQLSCKSENVRDQS